MASAGCLTCAQTEVLHNIIKAWPYHGVLVMKSEKPLNTKDLLGKFRSIVGVFCRESSNRISQYTTSYCEYCVLSWPQFYAAGPSVKLQRVHIRKDCFEFYCHATFIKTATAFFIKALFSRHFKILLNEFEIKSEKASFQMKAQRRRIIDESF